jgi:two-component system nitrogen regulation response regulator NtrX
MTSERVEESCSGWRRGASSFGPASSNRRMAGTLFIDEVADMPASTQGKILRVLT